MAEQITWGQRPYWLWFCQHYEQLPERAIGAGELFVVLMDRLEAYGIGIDGVTNAIGQLGNGNDGRRLFAELLQSGLSERQYEKLRELSGMIFDDMDKGGAAGLRQAIEQVANAFKKKVLKAHPAYFRRDGGYEPVHLSCLIYCVHLLEQTADLLLGPAAQSMADSPDQAYVFGFPPEWLSRLLDWTGDREELEHYCWRQELNEIMGVD